MGAPIRVGDVVRIVAAPDLTRMHPECRAETEQVFRYLIGRYKRIRAFEWGEAVLDFRIPTEGPGHSHTVWIETWLLKRRAATPTSAGRSRRTPSRAPNGQPRSRPSRGRRR